MFLSIKVLLNCLMIDLGTDDLLKTMLTSLKYSNHKDYEIVRLYMSIIPLTDTTEPSEPLN